MVFDPLLAGGLVVTGVFSACLGLLCLTVLQKDKRPGAGSIFLEKGNGAEFIFDGKILIDATPAGRSLLPKTCQNGAAVWPGLLSYLEQRFDGVAERFETLQTDGVLMMSSAEGQESQPLMLRAELRGGVTRVSILDADAPKSAQGLDPLTRRAIRDELAQLRSITAKAPLPIWRMAANGDVIWANARYLDLVAEKLGDEEDLTWPLPKLFATPNDTTQATRREKLARGADQKDNWFDIVQFGDETGQEAYALPADSTVKAEEGLRAFMQTLTKTFAYLSTGLAIFDQDRKLVLFNPALIDLTGLSPDLLTKRPTLTMFFDAMRENSMIPEPRDYKRWRNQITDIEEAAASGHYEETWSLSSGQTYRVIGRPHPNGALALSFEDISNEMSQTRRYRADLELGQAVVDAVDASIAVFSAAGVLVMSNAAYSVLWGHDPAASIGNEGSISAVCNYWREATAPTTIWDKVEDFAAQIGPRELWDGKVRLSDGRLVYCRFAPLAGGATMATFQYCGSGSEDNDLPYTGDSKMVG
ncbi:PAS domain-containing protein [Pseudorhodobacter turbinis]|uniref:PAS domain-containing protein n=1 Tax=Pseudorhodobacter turbinis TaxID=2500533 RepID=A0A4P8EGL4_9RHOB|nr:PAS-domain containing protein [Pseudorhodobacter turbinis]QCO55863.1 PAS domain-containing protein [Pseudorhodobacter turbinis]